MKSEYSDNALIQDSASNLLCDELDWEVCYAYNTKKLGADGTFGQKSYREIVLCEMFIAMGNLANGVAQQNLSPIKTGQIKILISPSNLLNRFEDIVSVYMKQMLNLNKQIRLLQETRDRLLPKLMNGEIEV